MKKTLFLLIVLLWLPAIVKAGSFNIDNKVGSSHLHPPTDFHAVQGTDDRPPILPIIDRDPVGIRPVRPNHHPTPIPGTLLLLGTGLTGLFWIKRKVK